MGRNEVVFGLGIVAIAATALTYITTDKKRKEVEKLAVESKLPTEYWEAKKEEAKASIEKARIETELKERLEVDARKRSDAARREKMAFEKNAPAEYWAHKKVVEEEETKRRHDRQVLESEQNRLEADKYIARKNSEALASGARSVGYALRTIAN